jgi:hypothetical protein
VSRRLMRGLEPQVLGTATPAQGSVQTSG